MFSPGHCGQFEPRSKDAEPRINPSKSGVLHHAEPSGLVDMVAGPPSRTSRLRPLYREQTEFVNIAGKASGSLMWVRLGRQPMGSTVAAYFDLDGTLLNASGEKTLTAHLARRRPWRIPWGTVAWTARLPPTFFGVGPSYDAARNRGHLSLASWDVLERYSAHLAKERLETCIPPQAWEKLAWHREQGHRLVLVTATVAPMAEAMAEVLGMDAVYSCGPGWNERVFSGSERGGWASSSERERCPSCRRTQPTTDTISPSATVMATPSPIHGSWRCAAMPLPSVQKGPFVVMLRRKAGPSWTGVPEFM